MLLTNREIVLIALKSGEIKLHLIYSFQKSKQNVAMRIVVETTKRPEGRQHIFRTI